LLPLKSSLKQITDPVNLLLEKIKSLDTTFRLADEITLDNNRLSSENIALKERLFMFENALNQSEKHQNINLNKN